jgi:hypothetical protein
MQLQKQYRRLLNLAHLDKNNPPPRWMTLLASFYLGMLLFLAAHLIHLI